MPLLIQVEAQLQGGGAVDVEYWEGVLKHLTVYRYGPVVVECTICLH
jgi:hypothetical protein